MILSAASDFIKLPGMVGVLRADRPHSFLRAHRRRFAQPLVDWDVFSDVRRNRIAAICQFQKLSTQDCVV